MLRFRCKDDGVAGGFPSPGQDPTRAAFLPQHQIETISCHQSKVGNALSSSRIKKKGWWICQGKLSHLFAGPEDVRLVPLSALEPYLFMV